MRPQKQESSAGAGTKTRSRKHREKSLVVSFQISMSSVMEELPPVAFLGAHATAANSDHESNHMMGQTLFLFHLLVKSVHARKVISQTKG